MSRSARDTTPECDSTVSFKDAFVWDQSGIRIRIIQNIFPQFCSWEQNSGNGIQVFRNENSSQTNAYLHYSNYSYSYCKNKSVLWLKKF